MPAFPAISRLLAGATIAAVIGLAVAGCGSAAHTATAPPSTAAADAVPAAAPPVAFIDVTLATLWAQPGQLRAIDAPSAANPVEIPRWLSRMTTDDRRWLVGRIVTQASYGVQVAVLERRGDWTKVAVRGQSTPLGRYGYPGWMPTRQLTSNTSLVTVRRTHPVAIVTRKIAWLRSTGTLERRIAVTYATRLYVVGSSGGYDLVATPTGHRLAIATSSVSVYASPATIPAPTGRRIVDAGERFLGLPYLWAGTSAYGYDCSGFTYTVFRRFGIALPRDADRQALHGTPVARSALRPGDLVFFAGNGGTGSIHHVAIYAGSGMMLESPNTGDVVKLAPLASMSSEYAGARRYL